MWKEGGTVVCPNLKKIMFNTIILYLERYKNLLYNTHYMSISLSTLYLVCQAQGLMYSKQQMFIF